MKNLLLTLGIVLLVFSAFPAAAQNLRVEYVEGEVLLASGSGWKDLAPGDAVPANGRLRLSQDGLLELSQGSTRLTVSRPGTYNVADLLASSKKVASWNLGQVVGTKLKGAVSGQKGVGREATSAGVRAERMDETGSVEWVTDTEAEEALSEGRSLLDQGRYEEALRVFQKALEQVDPSDAGALKYYIAEAHALQGRTALALQTLDQVKLEPQEAMYMDLVLLKGQLLLQSLAFNDALELFRRQLGRSPETGFAQALWIMCSYSQRGLGKTEEAREALQKAVSLDRDSELGQEAASLLQQL